MTTTLGRVRAPELRGAGGWLNTDRPLALRDLRGRVVVLDFWTFCCINCIRVVEELRPLEERFGDRLVVIGVHSPKFPHESGHTAVARAVARHRIAHPVLDDPELETWQQYGVRAWPTLVVIDPDGYVVAMASGEGNGAALGGVIAQLLDGRSDLAVGPAFSPVAPGTDTTLAFPGKVASDGGSRLAIADTGNDRVLVCDLGGTILQEFGGFHQPQGVRFDSDRLLVCDTVSGELVAVSLEDGGHKVLASGLRSPWDALVLADGRIAVAEAGLHRIVAVAGEGGPVAVLAGSRAEGLRDGPALDAHLAQPSGLAAVAGGVIAFADAEVSALRLLSDGEVATLVGTGLFDWGSTDGDRGTAKLQHPLGVAGLADGSIAVADTFNSLVRVWEGGTLRTVPLSGPLDEPGGLDALPDGRLVVADTNHHRVITVDVHTGAVVEVRIGDGTDGEQVAGAALSGLAGSLLVLTSGIDLAGSDLDLQQGPPVHVSVTADPPALLGAGPRSWALDALPVTVEVRLGSPALGVLSVDVIAATCEGDVCMIRRSTREHPLTVS
ncbi:MAG TPA: thioredoxin-like domain-containing protein [Candidatus Saccharimonadales bacterium]|nr:thioredoxin-like domain-containing protein [Candidatus Saccharimonadales bacterium]